MVTRYLVDRRCWPSWFADVPQVVPALAIIGLMMSLFVVVGEERDPYNQRHHERAPVDPNSS